GVVVLTGWVILLRAANRSLGIGGLLISAAFFGTLVWFLISLGWLAIDARSTITWIALLCLSALMAIGLSWSRVRRRLTGQIDVDDIDQVSPRPKESGARAAPGPGPFAGALSAT